MPGTSAPAGWVSPSPRCGSTWCRSAPCYGRWPTDSCPTCTRSPAAWWRWAEWCTCNGENCVSWSANGSQFSPLHVHRSEEHTSELQSRFDLVCRLLLEKKKKDKCLIDAVERSVQ